MDALEHVKSKVERTARGRIRAEDEIMERFFLGFLLCFFSPRKQHKKVQLTSTDQFIYKLRFSFRPHPGPLQPTGLQTICLR